MPAEALNAEPFMMSGYEFEALRFCSARNRCHFFRISFSSLSLATCFSSSRIRTLSLFMGFGLGGFFRLS
ncbi:MAG: hypothetical protein KKG34_03785, partial [Proteobacteria bacterium]|nr:hypothetical protein [Pseudomonadota bacterium]